MENQDCLSPYFLATQGSRSVQTNHDFFFFLEYYEFILHDIKRGHCFKASKEGSSFQSNDDTINVQYFTFLFFPAVNTEFFLCIYVQI